ncbi:MAG: 50S ribosomal protein L32 [Ureaplasma sp.]|nr:50S ribosomal protein L32 [Ureaplasma sp.]MDE6289257.1 50S ribosomal protein L32 [Ureaplasma sp.]
MAVQQRRVSKSRKGMRRSHDHLEITTTVACKNCGTQIKPHRVCRQCGQYRDKKIFNI